MSDTYRVPSAEAEFELKEKGSRFIARVIPVASEEQAEARIHALRKAEHDATHHCTAFRLGADADLYRSNDDGEPSGTAGAPILRQIEGCELTDILVVVTRYYGGTKLGTGGLIRAYGAAASGALDATPVRTKVLRERLAVVFAYDDTSPAMHTINRFDGEVTDSDYGVGTRLVVAIPRSKVDAFRDAFTNALGGRGRIEKA